MIPSLDVLQLAVERILIAHWTKLAKTEIVLTHVNSVLVEQTQIVWYPNIWLNVDVNLVIPVIHIALVFHLLRRNVLKTRIVRRIKYVWTKNASILVSNCHHVWLRQLVYLWIHCLFELWFVFVLMVISRMIKEVVEHCLQSYLVVKEMMNVVNPLLVLMLFVKILAVVDSMPNVILSTIVRFVSVIQDSMVIQK